MTSKSRQEIPANYNQKIRQKRIAFHLTYKQLANFLGVAYTTIYNWENKKVYPQNEILQIVLNNFLKGKYDPQLGSLAPFQTFEIYRPQFSKQFKELLQRIYYVFALCESYPDLQQKLIQNLIYCCS